VSDEAARNSSPGVHGVSRRDALRFGSVAAGGVVFAGLTSLNAPSAAAATTETVAAGSSKLTPAGSSKLPVAAIEKIIGAQGMVSNGVLNIEVDRDDLRHVVNSFGVPIKPAFEVNGNIVFQGRSEHDDDDDDDDDGDVAVLNGDLPFLAHELQPGLDQMLAHGIVFQAMHQHFYDWDPMVWFIHFRGRGDARTLARGVAAILSATATPLPQTSPTNPKTPLDTERLSKIIGASARVGADGVVSFDVPRRESITLGGTPISPDLNVATTVAFEPLGSKTAVVVDYGMTAAEIQRVTKVMRSLGWQVGCLYNQETAELPQLYFAHQFKSGDPYRLAGEVRRGLDLMNVELTS